MLNLEKYLTIDKEVCQSPNLAKRFTPSDLSLIGGLVHQGYTMDKGTRSKWEERMETAMDLAMQLVEPKNFPWPNASNVAFPLITIATLQFHSRAYPTIVQAPDLVKCKVLGDDPDGTKHDRAKRVAAHMSYQLLEEDENWEAQQDKLLINLPVVGCAFKKTFYSGKEGKSRSELVMARDLILNYHAKDVDSCNRKTHVLSVDRNEIHTKIMTGIYTDVTEEGWYQGTPTRDSHYRSDRRDGLDPPTNDYFTPFTFLEQHCWFDLDGDGYAEPYIITIEISSQTVMRIVARWDEDTAVQRTERGKIISITPKEYFTKYTFIPSPDGGIYDLGFGIFLGPLNEAVNSLVNQLTDAGTMANTAGGFLARGAKIRSGGYTFAPLEWKRVDATGDDLKKSIFPLPVREPSNVLFQLLSLLIDYTNRISGATETLSGQNPGQNTAAETTQTMVEQGLQIYSAIYKRVWRAMKQEFSKLYILNREFLPIHLDYPAGFIRREDYLGEANAIVPAADPTIASPRQRLQRAMTIKQGAMGVAGYNLPEVEKDYLRAMNVDDISRIYPGPDKVPPISNPKIQVEQLKLQGQQAALQAKMKMFAAEMQEEIRMNDAKIVELQARAAGEMEKAGGVRTGHEIAAFEAAIGAMKVHNDGLHRQAELMMKLSEGGNDNRTGMAGLAPAPNNQGNAAGNGGMEGGSGGQMA